MRFGVSLPNNQGVEDPRELIALARHAEALGYDSVWVSDHLFHAAYVAERLGNRPYHEPLTVLSAVAVETERVALGTSVLVLPWHQPVRLAKALATLDGLSRGRVIVGAGVGTTRDEYAALGVPFDRRGQIADEMLDALRALWTEDLPEYRGEFVAFSGLRFAPKPVQVPHPPLWIGGNSTAALRRVVRAGTGWHPLGLSPDDLGARLSELRQRLTAAGRQPDVRVAVRVILEFRREGWDRPAAQRRTCRGTPDEIADVVRTYRAAGATELIIDCNTPDLSRSREEMERFQKEVATALD